MIIEHVTWKDRIFSGKFFCREKKSKASATKLFNFYRVRGHTIGQDTRVAVEKDKERRISIYKYKPLEQFQLLFVLPPPLLLDADSSCEYSPHGFLFDYPLPFFFFFALYRVSRLCYHFSTHPRILHAFEGDFNHPLLFFDSVSFISSFLYRKRREGRQIQGSYLGFSFNC